MVLNILGEASNIAKTPRFISSSGCELIGIRITSLASLNKYITLIYRYNTTPGVHSSFTSPVLSTPFSSVVSSFLFCTLSTQPSPLMMPMPFLTAAPLTAAGLAS